MILFSLSHINARSIISGLDIFRDYFSTNSYDVIGVTETWLTPGVVDEAVALDGYALVRLDRDDGRRGGGVALYIKNKFAYTRLTVTKVYAGFEYLLVRITVNGIGVTVGVVYRPPHLTLLCLLNHSKICCPI